MAQLSDDCFAFSGPLMPIADAERLIAERVTPVGGSERVLLRKAAGRVLAQDVVAPVNVPPFDNSAVDGYAVRAADLDGEGKSRLTVVDRVMAGHAASQAIKAGEAIRIFTGAPMPVGADTVFMQEDCRVEDDAVIVPPGLKRGSNRRLAGEDIRVGAVALPAGRRLAVRKLESGKSTSTTSPRLYVIVDTHFRPVPVSGKGRQPMPQVVRRGSRTHLRGTLQSRGRPRLAEPAH